MCKLQKQILLILTLCCLALASNGVVRIECSTDIAECSPFVGYIISQQSFNKTYCSTSTECDYKPDINVLCLTRDSVLSINCSLTNQKCFDTPYITFTLTSNSGSSSSTKKCMNDGQCTQNVSYNVPCLFSNDDTDSSNLGLILGISGGVLVVGILLVVCIVKKRKNKMDSYNQINEVQ